MGIPLNLSPQMGKREGEKMIAINLKNKKKMRNALFMAFLVLFILLLRIGYI